MSKLGVFAPPEAGAFRVAGYMEAPFPPLLRTSPGAVTGLAGLDNQRINRYPLARLGSFSQTVRSHEPQALMAGLPRHSRQSISFDELRAASRRNARAELAFFMVGWRRVLEGDLLSCCNPWKKKPHGVNSVCF